MINKESFHRAQGMENKIVRNLTSNLTRPFVDFGSPDCALVGLKRIILVPSLSTRPLQTLVPDLALVHRLCLYAAFAGCMRKSLDLTVSIKRRSRS